jgi:hypothetical protein
MFNTFSSLRVALIGDNRTDTHLCLLLSTNQVERNSPHTGLHGLQMIYLRCCISHWSWCESVIAKRTVHTSRADLSYGQMGSCTGPSDFRGPHNASVSTLCLNFLKVFSNVSRKVYIFGLFSPCYSKFTIITPDYIGQTVPCALRC